MKLYDIPMLLLAWFCLTKPPITYWQETHYDGKMWGLTHNPNIEIGEKAYQWWWEDLDRAKYLWQAASLANLVKPGEVASWMGLFANSKHDTKEMLSGFVWTIKMRWYGKPVEGDRQ